MLSAFGHAYAQISEIIQEHPLNLSILLSGGKENNRDAFSNGEWSRQSSRLKSVVYPPNCSLWNWYTVGEAGICEEPDSSTKEGDSPV